MDKVDQCRHFPIIPLKLFIYEELFNVHISDEGLNHVLKVQ